MSEIYQTDKEFPTAIQEWGCFFLSILKQLVIRLGVDAIWNHGEIVRIYENEEIDHDLGSDLTVKDAQGLCDHVVGEGRIKYSGGQGINYPTSSNQFEILVYHRNGADFNHFVCGDGSGKVIYDPWSKDGSRSVREGICIGKRIFNIV